MISAKKLLLAAYKPFKQVAFTTPGTYQWRCPPGITSVCAVAIGGGDYAGGGLGWANNIPTTPGTVYTVVVGGAGQDSYFISPSTVRGMGASGINPGGFIGDDGGIGGKTNAGSTSGGGGAGGYTGKGGDGQGAGGTTGAAGGGGGGGGFGQTGGAGGGGVGLFGEGRSGATGANIGNGPGEPGTGGSGGGDGQRGGSVAGSGAGGLFGAGRGRTAGNGASGTGAVRIIAGKNRAFPSTNTGDI